MKVKIKDKLTFFGTANTLKTDIVFYDLESKICKTYNALLRETEKPEDNQFLLEFNTEIPGEILEKWSSDDSVIIKYIAKLNNLTIL